MPVAKELPSYRPHRARRDAIAAITVAALAIPSAMAYAQLSGLSPIVGLYALILPSVAYAVLGSSRQLIVGPEGTLATLVAAAILPMAAAGSHRAGELAAWLALLVGACFVLARILRLGWIADYLSRPVLVGYIHGVVVILIIGQLGKLLGLSISAQDPLPQLVEVVRELGDVNGATVVVSAVTLTLLLLGRWLLPRFPVSLVVVIAAIAVSEALDLHAHGVAVVGHIPSGIPPIGLPTPPVGDALQLIPAAVGLFLVCFADAILTARSYAGRHGQHVDVGQELLAIGAANAVAGVSSGMPVGASGSRTAVNDAMGARSQVSGLIAAAVIVLVLLFATGPIADLPSAVLGAAIVVAAIGLVDIAQWRELIRADRVETAIAAVTAIGVIATGVLEAIIFAIGLSIVDVVRRSATPHDAVLGYDARLDRWADVSNHPLAEVTPGVVVYRLDDRLFFANVSYVRGRVTEALAGARTATHTLVFDAEAVAHVDAAGLELLHALPAELAEQDVTLRVARVKGPVRQQLREAGVVEDIGADRFHGTVAQAVDAATSTAGASGQGRDAR